MAFLQFNPPLGYRGELENYRLFRSTYLFYAGFQNGLLLYYKESNYLK